MVMGSRRSEGVGSLNPPFKDFLTMKSSHGSGNLNDLCHVLMAETYAAMVEGALFCSDRLAMNLVISRGFAGECMF